MTALGAGVSLNGIFMENWQIAFNLKAGIVAADIGKALTLDTAAANTVKLSTVGDVIIGRLETVEDRTVEGLLVGTVSMKGMLKVPFKTGETMVVGASVQGSSVAGEVQPLAVSVDTPAGGGDIPIAHTSHDARNMITEVLATDHVILMLF